jgi:hypothetical protein
MDKKLDVVMPTGWLELRPKEDVPQNILDWYDWPSECDNEDGWIRYKKTWYHVSDFVSLSNNMHTPKLPENHPFKKWDGYCSDSFFSGVLIKFSECEDMVKLATYIS